MILSTCSVNQVGLGAKVDITPPKVQITSPVEDGLYIKGDLALSGTVSDDLGVTALTVSYPSAAGGDVVTPLAVSGGQWSVTIPSGTATGLPEGEVTLVVSASDASGKATTDTLFVYIDNKAPAVLITSPVSYAATAADAPQYTDAIDIKGEVYDPYIGAKGSVKVRILDWSRKPIPSTADPVDGWVVADGTNTFSVRFLLKGQLLSAADDKHGFYYEVEATDKAGNVSSHYYHRNDVYDVLPADTIFPAMNELGQLDQAATGVSPISSIPYLGTGGKKGLADIQLGESTTMATFQYSDTSKPKIKFSSFDQSKTQGDNALASNAVISGSITPDANGGAIDPKSVKVEFYKPNAKTGTVVSTIKDTVNTDMSDNIELLGFGDSLVFTVNMRTSTAALPPGPYSIKITATAKGSTAQSAVADFTIDDNAPQLTETKIGTGALTPVKSTFKLEGIAHAGTALETIKVFQAKDPDTVHEDSDQPRVTIDLSSAAPNTDVHWTTGDLPLPVDGDTGKVEDGTYYYVIKLTSASKKTATVYRTVLYDATAPVLDITSPASPWVSTAALTLKGTADDGDGTGVEQVRVLVDKASVDHAGDTSATILANWKLATGTVSWSYDWANLGTEGAKKLWVASKDKAGNWTPTAKTYSFGLDLADPTLTETTSTLTSTLAYSKAAVVLGGAATDGNAVTHVVVTYQKDGGTSVNALDDTNKDGTWTWTLPAPASHSGDGLYDILVKATDGAGKTSTLTRRIQIDTTAPDLTVSSPAANELVDVTSYTIRGQVTDNGGKGIASLEYSKNSTNGTDGTWTAITLSGLNWSVANVDFSTGGQGAKTLWVRASDGLNTATKVSRSFNYDTDVPTLSETTVGTSNQIVRKAAFSFGGSANDTNALANLKVTATRDGVSQFAGTAITVAGDHTWTYTKSVSTSHTDDGLWAFTLTATDVAGRTVSLSRTVVVDTTTPSVTIDALSDPFYNATLPASGTADDTNGSVTVSGLAKVEYSTNGTSWSVAAGTDSWSKTFDISALAVGPQTLSVKSTDKAGNSSTVATRTFVVDRAAPGISETTYASAAYQKADLPFSVDVSDDYLLPTSALAVALKVNGVTVTPVPALTKNSDTGTAQNYTFTVPISYGDGIYQVTLTATDSTGRTTNLVRTINVDTSAPTLNIASLSNGDLLTTASATVLGTATDGAGSGIDTIEYNLDAAGWVVATGTVNWAATLSGLTDGLSHSIVFRATDKSGNPSLPATLAARTKTFKVDLALPALAETSSGIANANLVFKNASVTLAGTVTDANTVAHLTVVYQKDGGTAVNALDDTDNNGTWTYTLPFNADHSADGLYEVTVTATDGAGRTTSFLRKIQIDTTSPDLTITAPAANELVDVTGYTIRGQVTDNGGKGIASLEYSKNSTNGTDGTWTAITLSGLNWSVAGVNFSGGGQGAKTLWVRATDGLNPTTTTSKAFNYDTDVPTLSETTINTTNQVIKTANFSLDGLTADTNALASLKLSATRDGVASITNQSITFDADGADNILHNADDGPWTYSKTVDPAHADDGLWIFTLTATDVAGRTVSSTRTVLIDTMKPTVAADALTDPYYSSVLTASGSANDTNGSVTISGLAKVEYSTNGTTWVAATGTDTWAKTFDISGLGVGPQTLSVKSTDKAGNVSTTVTKAFIIDRAAPGIAEATYGAAAYQKADLPFSVDLSDDYLLPASGLTVALKVDGVSKTAPALTKNSDTGTAQNYTFTVPISYGDGIYQVTLTATDSTGRTTNLVRTINVDTSAPTLNIAGLSNGDLLTAASNTVLGTATDGAGSGIDTIEYNLDAAGWVVATGTVNWAATLSGLTDGLSHSIVFRATDKSGNTSVAGTLAARTKTFKVDLALPALAETSSGIANANLVFKNASVTLAGTVTDANTVAHLTVVYQKDGGTAVNALDDTDNNGTWTYTLPFNADHSADGLYEVTVTATDGAGRTTSFLRKIQIDTTSPDLTITAPAASELVDVTGYTIRGQVTDNGGKGIASLEYSKNSTNGTDGTWTAITLSGLNWSVAGVNFSTGGQGTKTLWVRATDGLNPTTTTSKAFNYDTDVPTLSETTVNTANQVLRSSGFSMGGNADDTNALATLKISATRDSVVQFTGTAITVAGDHSWTYAHPVNTSSHADDGLWAFTLVATDVAGRTVTTTRTVLVDTTKPVVSADLLTDPFYEAVLSASGSADDSNGSVAVSGLLKVEYSLDGSTWQLVNGTDSWAKTIDISGLAVGSRSLSVRATDRALNVSTVAVRSFTVDRSAPGITESTYSGTSYRSTAFAFSVDLSDDLDLATSGLGVVLKVDGVTKTAPTLTKNTDTGTTQNYTFTVPVSYGEGVYQLTLTATDSTGRTATTLRTVNVDVTPPSIVISSPSGGDVVSSSTITIAGTASDGVGSGLLKTEYTLDGTNWFALNGTTNWNKSVALGGEGAKTLSVRATDNVGFVSTPVSVAFNLDQTPPTLTEAGVGTSSPKRNASFTLSGTSSDTNGLKTWDDPVDGMNAIMVPYVLISDGTTSQKVTVVSNAWTFNYPVASDGSQDGNVTFTVTAEDVVGKQTALTRQVTIDTTKPVITVDGVISGLNVSTNQVNGTMTFRFSADDSGVGLEKDGSGKYLAYYTIVAHSLTAPASTAADIAGWTPIAPSSSSVFTFSTDTKLLADGSYDLWLGVRDAVPTTPNARAFKFSPTAPAAPLAAHVSLSVAQASDRPIIAFDNLNIGATQNSDNGLGKNPTILLTLQDDDKVSVATSPASLAGLQYRIDINNDGLFNTTKDFWNGDAVVGADASNPDGDTNDKWEDESVWYNFEEAPTSDGSLVQAKIKLTGFPQGVFGIQVRVRDNTDASSWASIYDNATNYSWQKSGIVPFSVDFGPPTIKVTAPLAGTYRSNLALTGTTKDLLGVVRVRYTFDGITETTVYNNPNPTVAIASSSLVAGLPYIITSQGNTVWTSLGASSPAAGTSFIASGPGSGTGFAKIDPSVDIPFSATIDTTSLATGEYTLQIIATDVGGSDATQQIPITIDKDLPTVSFLQPGAATTLNGASVKVSGEAADNRKVGAVFLWHGLVSDPNPALPSQTAAPSLGNPNGVYNAGGYLQLAGTGVWSTLINTTSNAGAQPATSANGYRIRVVAVDAIGNVGTPLDQLVTIDQTTDKPKVAFSNLNLVTPSRLPAGNVTIIGTITDDDLVAHDSIQIRLDRNGDGDYNDTNEGWVSISDPPPSDSVVVSWSHEITDMTSQGTRHVQVRAKDVDSYAANATDYSTGYGWGESTSVTFNIDNGPPTLDLTAPTIGQRFNAGQFTLTGSTNDTNGIHRILVWVDDNDDQVKDSGEVTTIAGASAAASTIVFGHTYTVESLNGTDFTTVGGVNTLGSIFTATSAGSGLTGTGTVRASLTTDETPYAINSVINSFSNAAKTVKAVQVTSYDVSNASTTRDLSIVYDPVAPTATFNTPNEAATVNGTINVSGLGGDNYQLDNIYYAVSPSAAAAPAFPSGYTVLNQQYSWNFNLDTTALTDGNYKIRIVAQDKALNNSSASPAVRNIVVDQTSDRPVFAILTLNEAGTAVSNLLPASLQVSGTVSDDDAVDKTKIEVRSRVLPAGTFGAWTAISGPPLSNVSLATWNHTFTGFTDGQYEFQLRAGDTHDGGAWAPFSSGTSATVKFAVDLNLPTGSISTPTQGAAKRADFTISGSSADASGIKKVSIAYDTGSGYGAETLLVNDTDASDGYVLSAPWTTTYTVTGSNDGQTFYRVTITDAFDKVRTYEQYFTVDTQAPANSFLLPASGATLNGSVELRGSSADANQITGVYMKVLNGTDPGTWAPGTNLAANGWTAITGTYNWNYRFPSTALTDGAARIFLVAEDAAGNRSNPTLAANQLSFTVNQATNLPVITLTTANNALLDNSGLVTGTVTDDDGVDTSTLEISFDNGSTWRAVSNPGTNGPNVTFSHALSAGAGLAERSTPYQVVVRVKDIGENFDGGDFSGPQDVAPVTSTSSMISIKKDDADPVAVVSSLDNGLGPVATLQGAYLNDKITLTGTATDGVGVSTVEARLVGVAAFSTATNTGTAFSTWTWALTGLTLSGSSVNLEVKVTDVNGRATVQAYTLLVDTTVPTVSFDSAALNPDTTTGAYNGNVTFRGGAADNILVNKVYYRFAAADPGAPNAAFTGWTLAGSTYSWTAVLNTVAINSTASDMAYKLWAVSVDGAGNVGTRQSLSFTINQASDRPVLTLSAPTAAQVFDVNAKALGTVTDDDGLTVVQVRIDRDNNGVFGNVANETYVPVSLPASISGKSINLEHVLSTLADGSYKLQVRANDSLFVNTATTPYNEVESAVISFSIDTAPPSLSLTKITVPDRYAVAADRVITSNFNGSYVNNDLTLELNASDASGIASVQVSTNNGTSWSAATPAGAGVYTYAMTVPLDQSFDGTKNIQYRTTDNNGKVTSAIVTLIVDTQEPVIGFTSPSAMTTTIGADAPNVNGTVSVMGTVSDSSALASVVLTGGKLNQALTNQGNNLGWKVTLDTNTFANDATKTTESPALSNIWRMPIQAIATDIAGNKSQPANSTGYIDIDPNSDKPIVTIAAPTNGGSVSGSFLISGSVTDDDGAQSVRLQVDLNNDGLYTNAGLPGGTGIDLNNDGDKNDDFENETVYKTITVTNGAWSILMNTLSELNQSNLIARGYAGATGNVGFKVTPLDINNLVGSSQTFSVYIDSTAPTIVGLKTDGVTPTTNPTPATGTLQKGTITVRALFKDDQSIPTGSMQVSFDGGSTFQTIAAAGGTVSADVGSGNPFTYRVTIPVDTTAKVSGGNGDLQISLRVTDQTFKQTTNSLTYHVDNTLPSVLWNTPATLTNLSGGIYSFSGSASGAGSVTANELFGQASDSGTISGVDHINVYFVKGGNFLNPKAGGTTLAATNSVAGDQLYNQAGTLATGIPFTEDTYRSLSIPSGLVDVTNDKLKAIVTYAADGSLVSFTGSSLPAPLVAGTKYYLLNVTTSDFQLSSTNGGAAINLTTTGSDFTLWYESATSTIGTHFGITIDTRTELGSNDTNSSLGDGDGFQESLKSKSGYDEWYSYFDSTKLPDGPLTVYFVAYDQAGNKRYGTASGQVANNPPGLIGVSVNGTSATSWKVKAGVGAGLSMPVVLTATDTGTGPNIADTGWKLEVLSQWGNDPANLSGAATATYSGWFYGTGGVRDFTAKGSGSALPVTATVPIYPNGGGLGQESSFVSGYWYLMRGTATDTDGNTASQDFYLRVNNADANRPVIKNVLSVSNAFDDFSQSSLVGGHIDSEEFRTTADITTPNANKLSFISTTLAGSGAALIGKVVYLPTGESRTITSFDSSTGTVGWASALTTAMTAGTNAVIGAALPAAGAINFAGTVGTSPTTTSIVSTELANNAFIQPGWTIVFANGEWRTITSFVSASGTVGWAATSPLNTIPTVAAAVKVVSPAQLSGTVKITGKVYDDTDVVGNVTVEISTDGGVTYPTTLSATKSNQVGSAVTGYTYDWTVNWDTTTLTNNATTVIQALRNVMIRVYASDAVAATLVANRPVTHVDVVPYVTSIVDTNGLTNDVLRGATGKYSVAQASNLLTLTGYNLGTSTTVPAAKVSKLAADLSTVTSPTTAFVSSTSATVSKAAASLTKSGYLTLQVNGVSSNNNVNDNVQTRNKEVYSGSGGANTPSIPQSTQWNDDRYLWLWINTQINPTSSTNGTGGFVYSQQSYTNPDMVMSTTDQPQFVWNDINAGNTNYNTTDSSITRRDGFRVTRPAAMALANINGGAQQRYILNGMDAVLSAAGDLDAGYFELTGFTDQTVDNSTQTNSPSTGANGVKYQPIQGTDYFRDNTSAALGVDDVLTYRVFNRVQHPKLIAESSTAATYSNIYVAYYDASPYSGFQSLQFVSWATKGQTAANANLATISKDFARSASVITIPGTANGHSSPYYSMVKIGTGQIAIAYYDALSAKLKMAYSTSAFKITGTGATEALTDTSGATGTTRETIPFTAVSATKANYVGKYMMLNNGTNSYLVWFYTSTAANTKPTGKGETGGNFRVDLSAATTTGNVADAVMNTIRGFALDSGGVATSDAPFKDTAAGSGAATQTITTNEFGPSGNAVAGTLTSNNTNLGGGTIATITATAGHSAWTLMDIDATPNVGQHVSMTWDGTYLYLAYYDFDNANLKFAKVAWNTGAASGVGAPAVSAVVNVDNYQSAGTWTNVQMMNMSYLTGVNTSQPVIAYYADSFNGTKKPIRYAFPLFDAAAGVSNGTTSSGADDNYSGQWDVVTVPTITPPQGGNDGFNKTQLGIYSTGKLPAVGWLGTKLEYAKLQPTY